MRYALCVCALCAALPFASLSAQTPPEPGVLPGVELTDISQNGSDFASAFPFVSVSPNDDNILAIGWRLYSAPIDTNAGKESRTAECHAAISKDGGRTFQDTNLMSYLRTVRTDTMPELWYCNAPWVVTGPDGVMYAGGAVFTASGVVGKDPKQGRQMVTVSRDGGETWSKGIPGLTVDRFAPGVVGIEDGKLPQDTPWDGARGTVDAETGVFYSSAQGYVAASDDRGKSFGTVHQPPTNSEEWPGRRADFAAGHGVLAAAYLASSTPVEGKTCPCLVFATSTDRGATFTYQMIADSTEFNPEGRVGYPRVAADPAQAGHFAVTGFTPNHQRVKILFTEDSGETWASAISQPPPADVLPVSAADMLGVGYTLDGRILAAWRGFRRAGAYNVFAGMIENGEFGPTIKVSEEPSPYPPAVQLGNYSLGGGDYSTGIAGDLRYAHVVFPYSPGGIAQRTYYARVPLELLGK